MLLITSSISPSAETLCVRHCTGHQHHQCGALIELSNSLSPCHLLFYSAYVAYRKMSKSLIALNAKAGSKKVKWQCCFICFELHWQKCTRVCLWSSHSACHNVNPIKQEILDIFRAYDALVFSVSQCQWNWNLTKISYVIENYILTLIWTYTWLWISFI